MIIKKSLHNNIKKSKYITSNLMFILLNKQFLANKNVKRINLSIININMWL